MMWGSIPQTIPRTLWESLDPTVRAMFRTRINLIRPPWPQIPNSLNPVALNPETLNYGSKPQFPSTKPAESAECRTHAACSPQQPTAYPEKLGAREHPTTRCKSVSKLQLSSSAPPELHPLA